MTPKIKMFTGASVVKSQNKISDFPTCVNLGRVRIRIWIGIKMECRIRIKTIPIYITGFFESLPILQLVLSK